MTGSPNSPTFIAAQPGLNAYGVPSYAAVGSDLPGRQQVQTQQDFDHNLQKAAS
jgi:hypothetical protein